MTFQGCFLPSLDSFGKAVSEKNIWSISKNLPLCNCLAKWTEIWWDATSGRFCIKFPQSRMKGEWHRLSGWASSFIFHPILMQFWIDCTELPQGCYWCLKLAKICIYICICILWTICFIEYKLLLKYIKLGKPRTWNYVWCDHISKRVE
jgi:hypothetical protein